jgi:hypothetical protein
MSRERFAHSPADYEDRRLSHSACGTLTPLPEAERELVDEDESAAQRVWEVEQEGALIGGVALGW